MVVTCKKHLDWFFSWKFLVLMFVVDSSLVCVLVFVKVLKLLRLDWEA